LFSQVRIVAKVQTNTLSMNFPKVVTLLHESFRFMSGDKEEEKDEF
jgi:hypothetical protein